jgi:glucose-6-phosphate 1-dehydrogenase
VFGSTGDLARRNLPPAAFHRDIAGQRWLGLFEHSFAFYKWKLCRFVG